MSLAGYHLPVHLDVQEIEVIWTVIPDPDAPMDSRGIDETCFIGVSAAVTNMVFDVAGTHARRQPITAGEVILRQTVSLATRSNTSQIVYNCIILMELEKIG